MACLNQSGSGDSSHRFRNAGPARRWKSLYASRPGLSESLGRGSSQVGSQLSEISWSSIIIAVGIVRSTAFTSARLNNAS